MRLSLYLASAASVLCVAMPAIAQDESDPPVEGQAEELDSTDDASGDPAVNEIIVTAQHRQENSQKVPIALLAASGEELANRGILDTQQLGVLAPGLTIRTTVGAFQPFIRGIGSSASIVENPVALYIDGVYLPQQREGVRELNDIEQIAVLKGPQGTLFGRNATGGVIQITTRRPSHTFQGEVNLRYGNYETLHGDVFLTGGITDNLAASFSASYSHQGEGWGRNFSTGQDTYRLDHQNGFSGKLLFEPTDSTTLVLSGDYVDRLQYAQSTQPYPGTQFGYEGLRRPDGSLITFGPVTSVYDTHAEFDGQLGFHGGGVSLTVEQDVGFADLVSISAYRSGNGQFLFDNSGVSPSLQLTTSQDQPSESYSQEVRLVSPSSGPLRWSAGVYYFHYSNATLDFLRLRRPPLGGAGVTLTQAREVTESVAGFAQVDWDFLPSTTLTVGGRYTHEKRSISGTFNPAANFANPLPGPSITPRSLSGKEPTFRVALNHEFSPEINGYLTFNTGFKSGGFNILAPTTPGYLPEKLKAYETGLKTELFDRRLRFNVSAFYYDYTNIQVNQIVTAGQIVVNGAGAKLYGGEIDAQMEVLDGLSLSGGLSLLHSEFTDYPNAVKNIAFPTKGASVGTGDAKGNRLPLAQKISGSLAIDYEIRSEIGDWHFNVTANHNGQYFFEADNFLEQPAYTMLNSSLRWTDPATGLSIGVWGKNLLDERVISQTSSQNFAGYPTYYGNPPRTYGVDMKVEF